MAKKIYYLHEDEKTTDIWFDLYLIHWVYYWTTCGGGKCYSYSTAFEELITKNYFEN